jgi:magnesium and cobalt exporter, CNNM family
MITTVFALAGVLIFLIVLSAFFSASETAMMSINRYRLRHAARKNDPAAKRILTLLERPDRLLGVVLIGNNCANIFASAVAAIIAGHFYGEVGVLIATAVLTLLILVFSESAPKTLAALYPERVAWPCSVILKFLLTVFYPLVWFINVVGNGVLRIFGVKVGASRLESLSIDELRTLLDETKGKFSSNYKKMLLRILDLEQVTVEEIMVPRSEIMGIDMNETWENILIQLYECPYSFVPLYKEDINHILGILNLRRVFIVLQKQTLDKDSLIALSEETYFVPQNASANQQLLNFRQQRQTVGLVVDEYGDIQGLITLRNILEEIVGEFTRDVESNQLVIPQKDGSCLVDAGMDIRDLNEMMDWKLPTDGPRTLSGLVIEYLEMIPTSGICTRLAGYPLEIVRVSHNTIKLVKLWPQLYRSSEPIEEAL